MKSKNLMRLASLLISASILVAACSAGETPEAELTEETIFSGLTQIAETPITPAPTLTPVPTRTPTPSPEPFTPTPTQTFDPYNTLIFNGLTHYLNGEFDQALDLFNQAVAMDSSMAEAYIQRSRVYIRQGEIAQASGNLEEANRLYDLAVTETNYAMNYAPEDARTYNNRGVAFAHKIPPSLNQAIIDLSRSIELDPEYVDAYNNRAISYLGQAEAARRSGDTEEANRLLAEALEDFNVVVSLDPENPDNYFQRGEVYLTMKNSDGALGDFNKVIELSPDGSIGYYYRALVLMQQEKYDQAVADFDQSIALDAEFLEAYFYRGFAYNALGDKANARKDLTYYRDNIEDEKQKAEVQKILDNLDATPVPAPTSTPAP